jgi:superfamily II DNA or RNA helicase
LPDWPGFHKDVISRIDDAIAAGIRRLLLVAPTGAGKTVTGAEIMRKANQGQRGLFLDHRREPTKQVSRKLYDFGVDHGIIQSGFPARAGERAQVASI